MIPLGEPSDTAIVKINSRLAATEENTSPREAIWRNPKVLVIPAAEGKQRVGFLPKPVFFTADHGMTQVSYAADWSTTRTRTKPSIYAAYAFNVEGSEEIRFFVMPVAMFQGREKYNQVLLQEMGAQGFSEEVVRQNCESKAVQGLFGYLDVRRLPGFLSLVMNRKFAVSGHDPEDARIELKSGWANSLPWASHAELTIIGDPHNSPVFREQGVYNYVREHPSEQYITRVKVLSDPFTLQTAGEIERELYQKVIATNKL